MQQFELDRAMGDLSLNASAEMQADSMADFVCNLCGESNRRAIADFGREVASCSHCGSSVRTRAIIRMLSLELFGANLPIPEFPRMKSLRGLGISDSHDYAERISGKFSYTNTFYHREPKLDIVHPPEDEFGTYDFIISSEVFEHVPPPADRAFESVFRLLKPNGILLLTVPYTLEEKTAEHFPTLHDYAVVPLAGGSVLVNRRADGAIETFDQLVFHGGGGAALEMRRFTERDLRRTIANAGFESVEIYGTSYPPFGIFLKETWSLPIAIRKQPFSLSSVSIAEIMEHAAALENRAGAAEAKGRQLLAELEKRTAWGLSLDAQIEERNAWATSLQADLQQALQALAQLQRDFDERTAWAMSLDKELNEHVELAKRFQAEAAERTQWAMALQAQIENLQRQLATVRGAFWTKVGRKLGAVS